MPLPIQLDRASSLPLQDQLFEQMRDLIVSGLLKANTRIIATRFLAEQVGVSRTTVLLVYEKLISEGYLKTRPTVGTFVCDILPDTPTRRHSVPLPANQSDRQALTHPVLFPHIFAAPTPQPKLSMDFRRSLPDSSLLPTKMWLRSVQRIYEKQGSAAADPLPPQGLDVLRHTLADWLAARRGIAIAPEQIIIVSGVRQAYAIISHLFQRRGDRVVVESPGCEEVSGFFGSRGALLTPIPVDQHGIMTDCLPENVPVSLACVSPARQNPLGGTLPLNRRHKLIEWARKTGAYIIEEDADSNLNYGGTAPLSLASLDSYGLVFLVGSLKKTLGAGLCLGYIVAPAEFAEAASAVKAMSDDGCSWVDQTVLADFIASGEYDRHLRRLRRTLMARRDCLIQALESKFGSVQLSGIGNGTQLTWTLPDTFPSARTIKELARAQGIDVYVVPEEQTGEVYEGASRVLVLSYAAMGERQIKDGIARLAHIIESCSAARPVVRATPISDALELLSGETPCDA